MTLLIGLLALTVALQVLRTLALRALAWCSADRTVHVHKHSNGRVVHTRRLPLEDGYDIEILYSGHRPVRWVLIDTVNERVVADGDANTVVDACVAARDTLPINP